MNKLDKNKIIKNKFDINNNNISLISIVFSILIIIYHSYPLFYGMNVYGPVSRIISPYKIGSMIVCAFFFMSGFMISKSIKQSKNSSDYLKKRIKKIFPGLIILMLFTVFIVAPVVSNLQKGLFLKNTDLYLKYFFDNILLYKNTVYSIPSVFEDNAYPCAINGSLWSIKHTFISYIIFIPFFTYFIKNKKDYKLFLLFYLFIFCIYSISSFGFLDNYHSFIAKYFGDIGVLNENKFFIENMFFFFTGVLYDLYSDRIQIKFAFFIIAFILFILLLKTPLSIFAYQISFPYILMCLMCLKTKFKSKDISYYIYLFGFVIQQTIFHYMRNTSLLLFMVLSVIITVIISLILNVLIVNFKKIMKNV